MARDETKEETLARIQDKLKKLKTEIAEGKERLRHDVGGLLAVGEIKERLYHDLKCPKCNSGNTWADFEYGNKTCRDCGEKWDGNSHTIHS